MSGENGSEKDDNTDLKPSSPKSTPPNNKSPSGIQQVNIPEKAPNKKIEKKEELIVKNSVAIVTGWNNKTAGRFDKLPKDQMKIIASKGGKAGKGISRRHYTKCVECEARFTCPRAFEEYQEQQDKGNEDYKQEQARCVYEIESKSKFKRRNIKDFRAFVSANPADLLIKITETYTKLEDVVFNDPSYNKVTNLMYLLINIYKLKFEGKNPTVVVNTAGSGNPTVDIKEMMKAMRELEKEKEPKPVEVNAVHIKKVLQMPEQNEGGDGGTPGGCTLK